ncbi:MAG: BrnT family toxin, partial [Burkholderiaceae bacterium]|nr:BrnT family toxin [Burkholderiaceae bacterium]
PMKNRLYFIVYVNIGTQRRVISLRKANRREFMHYEKETN